MGDEDFDEDVSPSPPTLARAVFDFGLGEGGVALEPADASSTLPRGCKVNGLP